MPMLAPVARRGFFVPPVARVGVREGVLSFEEGFHISHVVCEVDDQTGPLLPRDRLPLLE